MNRSKLVILTIFSEKNDHSFPIICRFLKNYLSKFLYNLSHKLLIMISNSSTSFVLIELVKVGHFGPIWAQMGQSILKLPMLAMVNDLVQYLAYYRLYSFTINYGHIGKGLFWVPWWPWTWPMTQSHIFSVSCS